MKNKLGSIVLLAALAPATLHALGTRIADQDPAATARGNAFAATADNPSAIYYNPAGIARLEGHQFSLGVYGVSLNSRYKSPGGAEYNTKDEILALPQFYLTCSPKDLPVSFGLGLYSPYGLGLEWPDNTPFRAMAKEGRITYLTLNPVVAWRILPSLSIAAGPSVNYSEAKLTRGLAPPGVLPPGDELRFKGNDTAVGFNVGVLWQPLPEHSIGLNYRGATRLNYSGTVSTTFPASASSPGSATFDFPQNIVVGYSFRPTTNWNFEVDVDWTDWESLDTVKLKQGLFPGGPIPLPFNWRSSFFYEFGATRRFEKGWSLSGGYIFSENTVPNTTFNPAVPDSNRHIFSVGGGRAYDRWSWFAAYQFAYGPERSVNNSTLANGSYTFTSHALTFNVGYRF